MFRQQSKIFYPGKDSGQPFKQDHYQYCYSFIKRNAGLKTKAGDYFDNFIAQADKGINYYEQYLNETNPHNPMGLEATFNIQIVDDGQFRKLKDEVVAKGIPVDDIVATEGCPGDDITVLGGKQGFFSHFCTLFTFNACYGQGNKEWNKDMEKLFSDSASLNEKVNNWTKYFD